MISRTSNRSLASMCWRAATALVLMLSVATTLSAVTSTDEVSVVTPNASVSEVGGGSGRFTISRTGTTGALTVRYAITGTATPGLVAGGGNDYLTLPGTAVIPDGATSVDVFVQTFDDAIPEGSESVVLTIIKEVAPPYSYIIGTPSVAVVTIIDNELTASMETPISTCIEPGAAPAGTPPDPFNVAVFRASFTSTALSRNVEVQFSGTAIPGVDYAVQIVYGQDAPPIGSTGAGLLLDAGRRSLDGVVVDGPAIGTGGTFGYIKGTASGIGLLVGSSRSGAGVVEVGDVVTFTGVAGVYQVTSVGGPGALPTADITIGVFPPLKGDLINTTNINTSIPVDMTGKNRLTIGLPVGYRQIEYEIYPLTDVLAEGAEPVVLSLVQSPDYSTLDPTVGTAIISDVNVTASIALISNAIEGSAAGVARVTLTAPFPRDVVVPYTVAGSATPGVDYTISGLNNAILSGTVTIPAGSVTADIAVTAINDALAEVIETVVISLQTSPDYVNVSSPGSTTAPSVTMNIADSTTPISVTPAPPSGTTGATSTTPTTVRTLPTSSSSKGCGVGSGVAILLALAMAFLSRQRLTLSRNP